MLLRDTRKAVDRLKKGGVPPEQAEAIVDLLVDADEQVATQRGLDELKDKINQTDARLTQQSKIQKERIIQRVEEVETRLRRWVIGGYAAMVILVAILVIVLQ